MIPIITHTASFENLVEDNFDADKVSYSGISNLQNVPCNIQPVSSSASELATGMFAKNHTMYLSATYSGIREGHRVTVSGLYDGVMNRKFIVEGVEDWSKGILPHYQLGLVEFFQ